MKRKKAAFGLAIIGCLLAGGGFPGQPLQAGISDLVNIQNGNFFYRLTDLYLPCFDLPLEINRSYNHFQARRPSPIGQGWILNYDLKLSVSTLGLPMVIEADGYENEYVPSADKIKSPTAYLIEKVVAARRAQDNQAKGKDEGEAAYAQYRQKMESDPEYLQMQRARYFPKSAAALVLPPAGTYLSFSRGGSTLTIQASGASRRFPGGRNENFDKEGRLLKIADNKGNFLQFTYGAEGRMQKAADSCGRFFAFQYNGDQIARIEDSLGRAVTYSHNGGQLQETTNPAGDKTAFTYDGSGRMKSLSWSAAAAPGKSERLNIQYYKTADRVQSIQGLGEGEVKYRYGKEKNYFWREQIGAKGTKKFFFYPAERRQVAEDEKGAKTVTVFSACCGKPERITDPQGRIAIFQYDPPTGNLIQQVEPSGNAITYGYDPRFQFVSQIDNAGQGTTRFVYDEKGNIQFARFIGKKGQKGEMKINYSPRGKIQLIQQGDDELSFAANAFGLFETVTLKTRGRVRGVMNTSYTPIGAAQKTTFRPNTPEVQQLLMSRIQQSMQILQPAGLAY